jgi:Ser/Thr protein kinase RdoA (MazF antagonist)
MSSEVINDNTEAQAYLQLGPDEILASVEQTGYSCDGHILPLNSYENRVYQVGISGQAPVVAKFYRPGRWSDDEIMEEHRFTLELAEYELPVIAPLVDANGVSLHHTELFRFAVYPRIGGRPPELDDPEHLVQLGRLLARIHAIGATRSFVFRPEFGIEHYGVEASQFLLVHGFIPPDLELAYRTLCDDLLRRIRNCFDRTGDYRIIRLHGDCHHGNILWRDNTPWLLDFDDTQSGPAIQDLWMLLSGERPYMTARLADILEGYTEFYEFDPRELHLVEALRTLRMMHHAAWIARRWNDRAFPMAFPYFNTHRYWEEHVLALREQAALMDEPALEWFG